MDGLRSASPGLIKVRASPLVVRRTFDVAQAPSGVWREILDAADVVSEGRTQPEGERLVYYGSTSLLLLMRSRGGSLPDGDAAGLVALVRADPHVRLRALRIARREAEARAGGELGTLRAEIDVAEASRGVALLVEVVARLCLSHGTTARRSAP
jgi:hypothetical protein